MSLNVINYIHHYQITWQNQVQCLLRCNYSKIGTTPSSCSTWLKLHGVFPVVLHSSSPYLNPTNSYYYC
ncbi:ORF993 [White spot syndrome virus]|uniref:ORF993 n=1 Tax=White spot syndrome virus TaxID=342409 RepID=A0A2D3I6M5_9VIRU|nr:ORF993 [White spot syndrome virus]